VKQISFAFISPNQETMAYALKRAKRELNQWEAYNKQRLTMLLNDDKV